MTIRKQHFSSFLLSFCLALVLNISMADAAGNQPPQTCDPRMWEAMKANSITRVEDRGQVARGIYTKLPAAPQLTCFDRFVQEAGAATGPIFVDSGFQGVQAGPTLTSLFRGTVSDSVSNYVQANFDLGLEGGILGGLSDKFFDFGVDLGFDALGLGGLADFSFGGPSAPPPCTAIDDMMNAVKNASVFQDRPELGFPTFDDMLSIGSTARAIQGSVPAQGVPLDVFKARLDMMRNFGGYDANGNVLDHPQGIQFRAGVRDAYARSNEFIPQEGDGCSGIRPFFSGSYEIVNGELGAPIMRCHTPCKWDGGDSCVLGNI